MARIAGIASPGDPAWHDAEEVHGVRVAIDGHLYNRDELGAQNSSAALIASLYRDHGAEGAVARLHGDFAIAIHDPRDGALYLARDRVGVKPLYYALGETGPAVSSQPGALRGVPGVDGRPDPTYVALVAASHYRYFDNRPERSPYLGIEQVPAAHVLRIKDGDVTRTRYWSLDPGPLEGDEAELAERYRELLLDSVRRRLGAARSPAFLLSGGMDSSSVIGSATRLGGKRHAYSAVYSDETFDEREEIRPMLDRAVEEWHPVAIGTPDVFGLVERMVAVHDEPVATATWLSHFLICERAREQGFGALFGGLGGDELNAGEYEYFFFHFADLKAAGRDAELDHEIERWAAHHDHPIYRKNRAVVEDALARMVDLAQPGRCLPDRTRLERYANALNPEFFDLREFEPVMEHPFRSYLANRAYQDMTRETTPCCLRAEDRQSTAFGLDHFDPFLDHRLVEFMFRVPGSLKIRDGVTKRLLREATVGLLPDATRLRIAKTGWNAPAHVWFSGRDREPLLDLVRSASFRERGIYDVAEVERLVDEHEEIVGSGAMRENHMMFLWQLVNLELWLRDLDG